MDGLLLTSTSATTVMTYTPASDIPIVVRVSLIVTTAATTVSLSVSWTDPSLGTQTYSWLSSVSLPIGAEIQAPVTLYAKSGTAVSVSATAGTANQVSVTGSIERLV